MIAVASSAFLRAPRLLWNIEMPFIQNPAAKKMQKREVQKRGAWEAKYSYSGATFSTGYVSI